MMVTALLVLVTLFLVYYVPGRMLVDRLLPEPDPEESFSFSLMLGLILVNTSVVLVVGVVGLFSDWLLVTPAALWTAGLLWSLVLALPRLKAVRPPWSGLVVRPTRTQVGLWVLALLGFVFFLGHYDHDLLKEDGCNVSLSSSMNVGRLGAHLLPSVSDDAPAHVESRRVEGGVTNHDFLGGRDGQVLGPSVLLSPFTSLFGRLGLRLTYAIQGLLLPGVGYVLGRAVLGSSWAGWATALLLTFNPWSLEARTFNENFLANLFGTLGLALLFRRRSAPVLAGLALSLFFMIRHLEVVVVPFVLVWLWQREGRRLGPPLKFFGAMLAGMAPCIIYHVFFVLWHEGGLLEAGFDRPIAPHSFFGYAFEYAGLLNFPFIPEPMRSPYQAYPNAYAYPLDVASHLGLVLLALLPAGLARLWSWSRLGATLILAWFVPLLAMVVIQSNWINPNKMGYHATAVVTLILLAVGGAAWLVERARPWWQRVGVGAFGLALPLVLVPVLQQVRAPLDQRVLDFPEGFITEEWAPELALSSAETEEMLALDRDRYAVSLLPDSRADHEWLPAVLASDWRRAGDELAHPWFDSYRLAMPDFLREVFWGFGVGISPLRSQRTAERKPDLEHLADTSPVSPDPVPDAVVLWLDLSRSPMTAPAPLSFDPGAPSVPALLGQGGVIDVVESFPDAGMPDRGTTLLAARDRLGTVYVVLAPGRPNAFRRPSWVKTAERSAADFPGARVPLRLPRNGVVRLVELRSYYPVLWYSRFVVLEDGAPRFTRALPLSPS